jgi:septal ring factor EnvC (AmiA/AmiB activator)
MKNLAHLVFALSTLAAPAVASAKPSAQPKVVHNDPLPPPPRPETKVQQIKQDIAHDKQQLHNDQKAIAGNKRDLANQQTNVANDRTGIANTKQDLRSDHQEASRIRKGITGDHQAIATDHQKIKEQKHDIAVDTRDAAQQDRLAKHDLKIGDAKGAQLHFSNAANDAQHSATDSARIGREDKDIAQHKHQARKQQQALGRVREDTARDRNELKGEHKQLAQDRQAVHDDRTRIATEQKNARALHKDIAADQKELHNAQHKANPPGVIVPRPVKPQPIEPHVVPLRAPQASERPARPMHRGR